MKVVAAGAVFGLASTSVGTLALAVLVAVSQWWQARKIREVHVIVNSQKTAMQEEIRALRTQLNIAEATPAQEE